MSMLSAISAEARTLTVRAPEGSTMRTEAVASRLILWRVWLMPADSNSVTKFVFTVPTGRISKRRRGPLPENTPEPSAEPSGRAMPSSANVSMFSCAAVAASAAMRFMRMVLAESMLASPSAS